MPDGVRLVRMKGSSQPQVVDENPHASALVEYVGNNGALVTYRPPSGKKYRFSNDMYNRRVVTGEADIRYFENLAYFTVTRRT